MTRPPVAIRPLVGGLVRSGGTLRIATFAHTLRLWPRRWRGYAAGFVTGGFPCVVYCLPPLSLPAWRRPPSRSPSTSIATLTAAAARLDRAPRGQRLQRDRPRRARHGRGEDRQWRAASARLLPYRRDRRPVRRRHVPAATSSSCVPSRTSLAQRCPACRSARPAWRWATARTPIRSSAWPRTGPNGSWPTILGTDRPRQRCAVPPV